VRHIEEKGKEGFGHITQYHLQAGVYFRIVTFMRVERLKNLTPIEEKWVPEATLFIKLVKCIVDYRSRCNVKG